MIGFLSTLLAAAALCAGLLFRQLRTISWQLTQLRVERDTHTALEAIGLPVKPNPATRPTGRTFRDLDTYDGIAITPFSVLRQILRHHPLAVTVAGAAALAAVVIAAAITLRLAEEPPVPTQTPPTPSAAEAALGTTQQTRARLHRRRIAPAPAGRIAPAGDDAPSGLCAPSARRSAMAARQGRTSAYRRRLACGPQLHRTVRAAGARPTSDPARAGP
ncbi:hypothetical protein [Streptomyces omiyaensis]|uniref:hypothetical protein n=1 Tax=Streptomyces omiyaensis TaxID=68247 RepID=UPI003700C526